MRIPRFPYLPLLFGLCFGTLLTLGLISTGAVASPLPSEVINIITNGSFEATYINSDDIEMPYNFAFPRYQGTAPAALDTTVARTGNTSIKIQGDGESRTAVNHRPAYIPVEGGQTYKASVWYKHDPNDQGSQVGATLLRLQAFENTTKIQWDATWISETNGEIEIRSGENFHLAAKEDPTHTWAPLEVTFTLPDNVNRMWMEAFNWYGDGTVWFDDFALFLILAD